jgi:hypothetical protein
VSRNAINYDQLDASALNAAGAAVPGIFYNPDIRTVLNAGQQLPLSIYFAPADALNYANVSKTVYINVNQCPEKHGFNCESEYSTFLPLNWG